MLRAILIVVTFIVYAMQLRNGFVTFDDDILVFNNPVVHAMTLSNIWFVFTHFDPELYIPFTFLIYQAEWFIGGGSPLAFHIVSLILHIANALLVMELLWFLTERRVLAFACAMIFAVHPLNTEAVSWISAQKDLLSSFFFLLSLLTYSHNHRRISVLTFTLGLLSKVSIISLPLILILIDIYRGRVINRRALIEKIPYVLVALLFGIIALFGKHDVITGAGPVTYILIGAKGVTLSLLHFFWPVHLSVLYPYTKTVVWSSPDLAFPLIASFALLAIAVIAARRNKMILLGFGFFLLTLLPTFSNIVKAGDLYVTSDRYMYLPMIGLLILGAFLFRNSLTKTQIFLLLLVSCFFAVTAHTQSLIWENTQTLFEHVLAVSPDSSLAHNKVGSQLFDNGYIDAAEKEFRTSLTLKENPRAHYNLGLVFLERNDFANAVIQNQKAIALEPTYAPAHVNLGYIFWKQGNLAEAKKHFRIAIENEINASDARTNLALIELSESVNAKP